MPDTGDKPGSAPLPKFSRFAESLQNGPGAGDLRAAYYLAYRRDATRYLPSPLIREELANNDVVSASFVTPYPPGFPVLVPGQVFSTEILDYMDALDTREIHGYQPSRGYLVFTPHALASR